MKNGKEMKNRRETVKRLGGALVAGGLTLGLAACSGLPGSRPPPRYFKLSPKSNFDTGLPAVDWQLIVETPTANAGLSTPRIALQRLPHEVEYYARANWTDTAPRMIQTLIVESFENSERIVSVGRESIGLRADYVLKTELREFQTDYLGGSLPSARVAIAAKLVRMPRRVIVGSWSYEAKIPAERDSIESVVLAFDDALGKVLKRLVQWSLETGESFSQG